MPLSEEVVRPYILDLSGSTRVLKTIQIENYKSIEKVKLSLGRVNVFIGENGAGKSNILEAIALAGAAQARKLDNEFLASRGIRVSGPELMRSAFNSKNSGEPIKISAEIDNGAALKYELVNDNKPYSTWQNISGAEGDGNFVLFVEWLKGYIESIENREERIKFVTEFSDKINLFLNAKDGDRITEAQSIRINLKNYNRPLAIDSGGIEDFIVFSPENSALRVFEKEGQIEPLGINGEGLLKLLRVMAGSKIGVQSISSIKDSLRLFNWFDDLRISRRKSNKGMEIFDQYLDQSVKFFDQRSANEGFLFLTFYLALFTSKLTPRFFAIDNVDTSLNPKLCQALMERLTSLARDHRKQVLLTTHNPAILDGLDINLDDNRLFVVSRASSGQTRVRRFEKKPSDGTPRRLSDLFLSGALGGLPKGF